MLQALLLKSTMKTSRKITTPFFLRFFKQMCQNSISHFFPLWHTYISQFSLLEKIKKMMMMVMMMTTDDNDGGMMVIDDSEHLM